MSRVQLQKVATIIMGTSPKGSSYNKSGEGLPLLNGPTEFGEHHPSPTTFTTESTRDCKKNDLIFCVRGSTTGRMNWADRKYALGRGVCAIRGETYADTRFIKYSLDCRLRELLNYAGGGTFPNLRKDTIHKFEIDYPESRKMIATILGNYDDLIENNSCRVRTLEQMGRLIYDEWFVKFKFPHYEKVNMVDSDIGEIPQGWRVNAFGEIAQQIRKSIRANEVNPDMPYVGLEHIPRKSIALSTWGYAREVESTKLVFRKGDILFGKIRPYFHKVAIAPVDGICSSDTFVIRPVVPEYHSLVLLCASSEGFVGHAAQTAQGTKMPRADWAVLAKYPVIVAPMPIISKFNEIIEEIVSLLLNTVHRNRTLAKTRDLLLPKLVSGDIDVSDLHVNGVEMEA